MLGKRRVSSVLFGNCVLAKAQVPDERLALLAPHYFIHALHDRPRTFLYRCLRREPTEARGIVQAVLKSPKTAGVSAAEA